MIATKLAVAVLHGGTGPACGPNKLHQIFECGSNQPRRWARIVEKGAKPSTSRDLNPGGSSQSRDGIDQHLGRNIEQCCALRLHAMGEGVAPVT
jgi:hypothetical protein